MSNVTPLRRETPTGEKSVIRDYWNSRPPQVWYSRKEPGTVAWFNELARKRYEVYYTYLPEVAEFTHHRGERVLEIGVGVGTDLVQFAKNGARVSGIDLTPNAVATTGQHLAAYGLEADYLDTGDAENLPFDDETFDVVYSFGVLHHTPDTAKAIREVHRVLKPEGRAIIMLYSRGFKHYFKRVLINGVLRGELLRYGYDETVNRNTEVHGGCPHTKVMTKREVEDCFAPFSHVEIQRRRLGEYFEYAPYETWKVPAMVGRTLDAIGAEHVLGENWIIRADKSTRTARSVSFLQTLLKP